MNIKRILVFILLAFIPMIGIGILQHSLSGIARTLLSSAAMMTPLLAVILTQLIFKEPVLKGLGISFKVNRWWWIGWLLMPVIALAVLGVSLLMPGAHWAGDSELVQMALQQMPEGIGPAGLIAVSIVSGLFAGATLNALFAFGEEIAWRGFLAEAFKGKNFLTTSIVTGTIWGFWHFPLILNGHNYPEHPVIGVFMMVLICVALTPVLLYFRQKSGSVIVPAIMHGTFNAVIGLSNLFVTPANDLLIGGPGLAGLIVLLITDLCIFSAKSKKSCI
ncbi:MAG: CPBP family intramembrane metalloprotease [Bacteroidales bacterium]|nr:CPBP family intramembrane metalloprotease [Bacteroidales bacterium]